MAYLHQSQVFGVAGHLHDSIHYIDDQSILYPAGSSLIVCNFEQKSQRFISLSEGGGISAIAATLQRLVAVAERGDGRAIVTIYDTQTLRKKKVLHDEEWHGKEIVALAFSPDLKYLAVQLSEPEWQLQMWNWEKNKVYAHIKFNMSNIKIHQISFNPYEKAVPQICVVGLNIFRLYRYTEGILKPIMFNKTDHRNNLCHTWLTAERVVIATEECKFLYYDNGELKTEVPYKLPEGSGNSSNSSKKRLITVLSGITAGFIAGTNNGIVQMYEKAEEASLYRLTKEVPVETAAVVGVAISGNEDNIISMLSNNQVVAVQSISSDDMRVEKLYQSHQSAAAGLDTCIRKPLVATCGSDRSVRIWNYQENTLESIRFFNTEPLSVAFHPSGSYLFVGFADSAKLLKILLDDIKPYWEQPARNCRECKFSNGGQYFAMAQESLITIKSTWTFETVAFLRGHTSRVRSLCWSHDDAKLLSVSLDGSIFDWDVRTQKRENEITLTNYTCSSAVYNVDAKVIFVACSDGVLREIRQSQIVREILIGVPLSHVAIGRSGKVLVCGTAMGHVKAVKYPPSATDIHDTKPHASVVTHVVVSHDEQNAFSVGEDGCLCVFRINDKEIRAAKRDRDNIYSDEILALRHDVSEQLKLLTEVRARVEEIRLENERSLRKRDTTYADKLKETVDRCSLESNMLVAENNKLRREYEANLMEHAEQLQEIREAHRLEKVENVETFEKKMITEKERYNEALAKIDQLREVWKKQMQLVKTTQQTDLAAIKETYEARLQDKDKDALRVVETMKTSQTEQTLNSQHIEEVAQNEIVALQFHFQQQLRDEQLALKSVQQENVEMHKRYEALLKKIESNKQEVLKMAQEEKKLQGIIRTLERDITAAHKEHQERVDTVEDKEKRIRDLKKKNKELEKFKFVLDYKIVELRKQIEPREANIVTLMAQIKDMETELSVYRDKQSRMVFEREELLQKLRGTIEELSTQRELVAECNVLQSACQRDTKALWLVSERSADPADAKRMLVRLFHKYCLAKSDAALLGSFTTEQNESAVQRQLLEKSVGTLNRKLHKERGARIVEARKLIEENVELTSEINALRAEIKKLKTMKSRAGI
ncbi:Cilia- and flagella-associated protein 57 [Sorochytrium milnesiophthora]